MITISTFSKQIDGYKSIVVRKRNNKKSHPPSVAGAVEQIFTSYNKRLSEMAVGVETCSLLRPSTSVIAQVMAHPIRHFAKPPGVM